ncbi:uncharacterized protein [Macrobrachium rosenbergii]|uniref:uncharacterized protein n=1 Tax=Macrobrachium rosenbergii TaxID=79674 RepID=UPI0034D676E3
MPLDKFLRMVDAVHLAWTSSEPTQPPVAAANPQPQQQNDTETDSEPEVQPKTVHVSMSQMTCPTHSSSSTRAHVSHLFQPTQMNASTLHPALSRSIASGAALKTYGKRTMKLSFNGKSYGWTFITADVIIALLGADFLKAHDMLVDVARQQLIQRDGPKAPVTPRTIANLISGPEICRLFQEVPEVFKDVLQHDLTSLATHNIKHHIITEGSPVHAYFKHLAPDKLTYAKQAFHDMELAGICQKASN